MNARGSIAFYVVTLAAMLSLSLVGHGPSRASAQSGANAARHADT